MKLPAIMIYDGVAYRPAGYREPSPGEKYIGKDGHIKTAPESRSISLDRERLIVRVLSDEDFLGKSK